jgi:hypothetical protein
LSVACSLRCSSRRLSSAEARPGRAPRPRRSSGSGRPPGEEIAAALLAGFAAVFLVWFGAVVRTKLRDAEGESGRIAAAAFGGFLLIAAGGLSIAGFQFTAADTAGDVPATVTQALAALNRDFFFLLDGGVLIAVFATAAATVRHAALPRWYGYLSIAVGLIFLTPAFAVAFAAFGVWTLLLSLLTFRATRGKARPMRG